MNAYEMVNIDGMTICLIGGHVLKGKLIKVHDVVHGASCGGRHVLGRYQM